MRCLGSSILSFATSQFDLPTTQKKLKLLRLPKIEGSIFKYRAVLGGYHSSHLASEFEPLRVSH